MSDDTAPPIADEALEGSKDARRDAVLVLELLSGVRSPAETSAALGCSITRVYQLEARALQGVIAAMEPRPRGRQPDLERKITELERAHQASREELARTQALLRAAYRSFGLPASQAPAKKEAAPVGKRRRKPLRARKAIARIVAGGDAASNTASAAASAADSSGSSSGKPHKTVKPTKASHRPA